MGKTTEDMVRDTNRIEALKGEIRDWETELRDAIREGQAEHVSHCEDRIRKLRSYLREEMDDGY